MPKQHLQHPPLPPAPWNITTERHGRDETSIHTLRCGDTAIEQRTGPHGLSLLSDIRDHLNATGGKPTTPPTKPTARQPELF